MTGLGGGGAGVIVHADRRFSMARCAAASLAA
jgi:hypothetical protein